MGSDLVEKIYLGPEVIWPTEIDYSTEPLTLKAVGTSQASITVNSQYSGGTVYYRENGGTWSALRPGQRLDLFVGTPVQLMGLSGATGLFSGSTPSGAFEVYGNVMSLIYRENFIGQTTIPSQLRDCFYATFRNCQSLVSIKHLVMPATTLSYGCYRSMFNKCVYLTELPDVFIPAEATLTEGCCRFTFEQMAAGASTPVEVPFGFLPSTNLVNGPGYGCYESMFRDANISVAPMLPATSPKQNCYKQMYSGCRKLNTIYCLLEGNMFGNNPVTSSWVQNVAATGTFYKSPNFTWSSGNNGVPTGWTVQDYVEPNA